MQYSLALAALGASAVMGAMQPVSQIVDGQIQAATGAASAPVTPVTSAPVEEETVYSTKHIVITSCPPEVVSCPARSYHTTSTVIPIVVSKSSASAVAISTPAASSPNSPAVPVSSAEAVSSVPAVSSAESPAVPVSSVPAAVASPSPAAASCPVCPVQSCPAQSCPAAVTVTVTATPIPTSSPSTPNSPAQPAPAVSSAPAVPAVSSPAVPAGVSTAPVAPAASSVPSTPNSPVQPSGVAAPSGTAASTGVVPFQPSSSPITPFKGAASSLGSSIAMAGLAAFAAIILA